MLGDAAYKKLINFMGENIKGVVLRNDLKNWCLGIQAQDVTFLYKCTGDDLVKAAGELNIRIVNTRAEYDKYKTKDTYYNIPNLEELRTTRNRKKKIEDTALNIMKESREKLYDLYHTQDKCTNEIAEIYGCSIKTLYKRFKEESIELKHKHGRKLSENDVFECMKMSAKGMTYQEIAEKFHVHKKTIENKFRNKKYKVYEENVRLREVLKEKEIEIERLNKLLKECS